MKITDEYEMSDWALNQYWRGDRDHDIRDLITDDFHLYLYCLYIEDTKCMRDKIKCKLYIDTLNSIKEGKHS